MTALARRAHDVLRQTRASALSFVQSSGLRRTKHILQHAQADLERRLASTLAKHGEETFTVVQMRSTLAQVKQVLADVSKGLGTTVLDASDLAADKATDATLKYLHSADKAFRGVGSAPLALREASMFERARHGARSSVLHRLTKGGPEARGRGVRKGVLTRYGEEGIRYFERTLSHGMLVGKSQREMADDLRRRSPFLREAPAHWATRIVRTEVHGAYSRSAWEGIRQADEEIGGMVKIISSVFDERTGADSYAVHGQIRRPEEAFESWYGMFQHPPDRPNDRGIVVPHNMRWNLPAYLQPRDPAEVAARWASEGHKQAMPELPQQSTVDTALFGSGGGGGRRLKG